MIAIHLLNGPNLNLLGKRETDIYGNQSFETYFAELQAAFSTIVELHYFQSNYEGALIEYLHQVGFSAAGIVFNPGAHAHTSIALRDAVAAITAPVIEVHISNVFARESFRHYSFISPVAKGVITGLGIEGYRLAIQYLLR